MTAEVKRGFDNFINKEVADEMLKKVGGMESYCYREIVKKGARASGAFTANINRKKGSPNTSFDKNKTSSIEGRSPVDDPYATYYVTSAAPYANRLEHGWSDKQPLGLFNLVGHAASVKFR